MKKIHTTVPLFGIALILAGCGRGGGDVTTAAPASDSVPPALATVFTLVGSEEAILPIPELRETAKPGDEVVLEAKVMGTKEPFVDKRALFVVGDEATLISCDIRHGDSCETPWDNCCDDDEALRAGTATIQVVDDAGEVLRHGIRGVSGLKELSRVRVAGKVAPRSTEAAFIINATRIELL